MASTWATEQPQERERLTTPSGKTIDFEQFGDVANIAEFYPASYMSAFAAAALAAANGGPPPLGGGHGHGHHAHAHAGGGPGPGHLGDYYPHDFGGYSMPPMNHHGAPYLPPDYGNFSKTQIQQKIKCFGCGIDFLIQKNF